MRVCCRSRALRASISPGSITRSAAGSSRRTNRARLEALRCAPPRRRAGRAHSRRRRNSGACRFETVGGDAGAAAGHRDRGRTGAGDHAAHAIRTIARCASPISAPAPAPSCWRCCANCRLRIGVGTDISREALRTARRNAARSRACRRARLRRLQLRRGACGPFRSRSSRTRPISARPTSPALAVEVRDHDPRTGAGRRRDGLDAYRALIPQAARLSGAGRRAGRGGRTGPERPD